jgi:hypothetical protein
LLIVFFVAGVARLERGALLRVLDSRQDKEVAQHAPLISDSLNQSSKRLGGTKQGFRLSYCFVGSATGVW